MLKHKLLAGLAFGGLGIGLWLALTPASAQQTGNIPLKGVRGQNCTITVNPGGSYNTLPFDNGAHSDVLIGSVTQNCNKKVGYVLWVDSLNCPAGTAGAKLVGAAPVGAESVHYTVRFDNPNVNPADIDKTNLLNTLCSETPPSTETGARFVSDYKVNNEVSTIYVNYSIPGDLNADTYTDTLTINMTVN